MLILRGEREKLRSKKRIQRLEKDLNSILNKWKWGDTPFQTSQEFLAKFSPWVNEKIKLGEEVKTLLERKGVTKLEDLT